MNMPPIVSPEEWEAARQELLVKEKELTRARDALAAERRRMPRMAVEKDYRFEGPDGPVSLLDLFEGRRQLIVYRFFFEPGVAGWPDGGCCGCSFMADQVAHLAHLNARDITLAYVSRAPQADIERWKARMGWEIPWYTITDDFDADFGVDEWHGTNVFFRDGDRIFRTYFVDNRGDEALGSTWSYLDLTALGRQEEWEDSPEGFPQTPPYQWWHRHDEYEVTAWPHDRSRAACRWRRCSRRLRGGHRRRCRLSAARWMMLHLRRRRGPRRDRRHDAADAAHLPGPGGGGLRRVDQRGGAAALVPRRARWETPEAEVDLRVGGAVRVVMRDPPTTSSTAAAATTPRSSRRRACVHLALGPRHAPDADRDLLRGDRRRTIVRFSHSGLWDEEAVRGHEGGWSRCFDNLERTLQTTHPNR